MQLGKMCSDTDGIACHPSGWFIAKKVASFLSKMRRWLCAEQVVFVGSERGRKTKRKSENQEENWNGIEMCRTWLVRTNSLNFM